MRFTEAIGNAGITYRQADHWVGQRYIDAPSSGSGIPREISPTEARVLCRMAALVLSGMSPAAAAAIARRTVEQHVRAVDLPGRMRLVFDGAREPVS